MARIGFIIGILILLSAGDSRCADVNEELRGINKEIREKKLLLNKTRKVETKVSGELEQIGKNLQEKAASLATLERELKGVESVLDRTQKEIEVVKGDADRKKQQISLRLSSLYKAGAIGGVRVFFSSESFPQMTENLRYMKAVLDNDKSLFVEYNARMERLKLLKASLERDVARKEKIKVNIEAKKQEIEEEKKKKSAKKMPLKEMS